MQNILLRLQNPQYSRQKWPVFSFPKLSHSPVLTIHRTYTTFHISYHAKFIKDTVFLYTVGPSNTYRGAFLYLQDTRSSIPCLCLCAYSPTRVCGGDFPLLDRSIKNGMFLPLPRKSGRESARDGKGFDSTKRPNSPAPLFLGTHKTPRLPFGQQELLQ